MLQWFDSLVLAVLTFIGPWRKCLTLPRLYNRKSKSGICVYLSVCVSKKEGNPAVRHKHRHLVLI